MQDCQNKIYRLIETRVVFELKELKDMGKTDKWLIETRVVFE